METTDQPEVSADTFDIEKARELLLGGMSPDLVAVALNVKPSTFRYQLRHHFKLRTQQKTIWELVPLTEPAA